jgi:hypothetical protein
MVKDFNAKGNLRVDNQFMTNADLPVLAADSLVEAVNPYTGKKIDSSKKDDKIFIYSGEWNIKDHNINTFVISSKTELINKNIFLKENFLN